MARSRETEPRGTVRRQPEIGLEDPVMQPAPDIIASRPAAPDHFVIGGHAAEIARPAGLAGLLPMDVAGPARSKLAVRIERHRRGELCAVLPVADKAVTRPRFAHIGVAPEIFFSAPQGPGRLGAAWISRIALTMLAKGSDLALTKHARTHFPAIDHFAQHEFEVGLHFAFAGGRAQHRREADAVEAGGNGIPECGATKISWALPSRAPKPASSAACTSGGATRSSTSAPCRLRP